MIREQPKEHDIFETSINRIELINASSLEKRIVSEVAKTLKERGEEAADEYFEKAASIYSATVSCAKLYCKKASEAIKSNSADLKRLILFDLKTDLDKLFYQSLEDIAMIEH